MTLPSPAWFSRRITAPLLLSACASAAPLVLQAQPVDADTSRITQVTVYPGSATVERVARVAAGARSVTFRCLPQGLDAQSLQLNADASVRIGESSVLVQDRNLAGGCGSPLDERVREAQDQLALARADTEALELAHTYLKTVAGTAPATQTTGPATPGNANIGVTTESLRRSAQDTLIRLHQAQRKQEALDLALKALATERDRIAGPRARVVTVTVTLAAERSADVRLTYQVRGPSWSPNYRASLNTSTANVRLERQALVAQNTGEDWSGVQLTLSTGQPTRATSGPEPQPWTLNVEPPPRPVAEASGFRISPSSAPPQPSSVTLFGALDSQAGQAEPMPDFNVAVQEGAFATEFAVPQRITVPSGGQRVTLALGQQEADAQLISRTTPAAQAAAYLVAVMPAPAGVWPTAPVALYRDNTFVGTGMLDTATLARQGLHFGRDERVQVQAMPMQTHSGSAGLTGARVERTQKREYSVSNRHTAPVALQVLEATPVSLDQQITVESRYEPTPTEPQWNGQPGAIAWSQNLAGGATARFAATHVVRYPKDLRLSERE